MGQGYLHTSRVGKRSTALIALASSLLVIAGIGVSAEAAAPRVVGGAQVSIDSVPWQAALLIRNSTLCGASIIGTQWLLTAAHCLGGASPNDISAFVGVSNLSQRSTQNALQVSGITINPSWDPNTFSGDIALLQLAAPLVFSQTIQPIALPVTQDPALWPASGTSAQVTGWGSTSFGGKSSDALLAANVSVLSAPGDNSCGAYGGFSSNESICAGVPGGGIDACQGDSGGPLVVATDLGPVLAGVTSVGNECALPNFPGIYTRVTTFLPWINQYVPAPTSTPSAPLNVATESQSRARVLVSWDVPEYDGGLPISGYLVSTIDPTGGLTPVCTVAISQCVVSGQKAGTVLTLAVQALNELGAGTQSPAIGAVVVNAVRTPPARVSQRTVARWAGVTGKNIRVRIAPASRGICVLAGKRVSLKKDGLCVLRVKGPSAQRGAAYLLGQ